MKKDVMRPFVIEDILKDLHWKEARMIWKYKLNGYPKKATIEGNDLLKIIKWTKDV